MPITNLPITKLPLSDMLALSAMTLATTNPNGEPHAAPVYFVADDELRLYFFSDPHSRHGQDIAYNPHAGVAIYPECRDWQDIRGVQMRGEIKSISPGPMWDTAWERYVDKFPFVANLLDIVAQNTLYAFIPSWIRLVDNRQGFGFKQEWGLP